MASVRLVDKVKGYTTADWDKYYEKLRKDLKTFRQEIGAIQERPAAIETVSTIDGYISLPVVMEILREIQTINYRQVYETFFRLTNKDFKKVVSKDASRDFFKKMLGKEVRVIFENLIETTRMADLTEEKVNSLIVGLANTIFDKGMVKYLKDGVTPESAKEQLIPLLCTELYLLCALDLYHEADKRQTAGWLAIKALMGPYLLKKFPAEALQNPFIAVRESAKLIQVNVETGKLWREAALWLEGLYLRSYLQVPEKYRRDGQVFKAENDKMPLADPADKDKHEKDKSFQDNFGLTLFEMASFHHQTAMVIDLHFVPAPVIEEAKPEISAAPIAQEAAALPAPSSLSSPVSVAAHVPVPQQSLRASLAPNMVIFQPPAPAAEVKGVTFEMLDNLNNEEPEVQFTLFLNYLKRYNLTEEQKDLFNEYSEVITSSLDEYINSRWNSSGVPTFFKSRPHATEAGECKQRILEAKTPYEQIKILFDFWKELKGNASWDLKSKVANCISHAVTVLFKDAKMRKESQLRMEAK